MKTIGLLGGMSWESTILYYQMLNEGVRERLGGLHSAKIVMHSLNFAEIERHQVRGEWSEAAAKLSAAASGLQQAGADMLLICTNLMHKVAPSVEQSISIPLLHIADAAGQAILCQGLRTVGLLGARYTMEEGFYRNRLIDRFGIDVVTPAAAEREIIHRIIFDELCQGKFTGPAREQYLEIINKLRDNGAEGIILGCTEIPLLIGEEHTDLPLFNTTRLHAGFALDFCFNSEAGNLTS